MYDVYVARASEFFGIGKVRLPCSCAVSQRTSLPALSCPCASPAQHTCAHPPNYPPLLPTYPTCSHPLPSPPPQVREVYEGAIEAQPPFALSDADTRTLCLRYAALERRLGEVDR